MNNNVRDSPRNKAQNYYPRFSIIAFVHLLHISYTLVSDFQEARVLLCASLVRNISVIHAQSCNAEGMMLKRKRELFNLRNNKLGLETSSLHFLLISYLPV